MLSFKSSVSTDSDVVHIMFLRHFFLNNKNIIHFSDAIRMNADSNNIYMHVTFPQNRYV